MDIKTEGDIGLLDTGLDNGADAVAGLSCAEDTIEYDGIAGANRVVGLPDVGLKDETDGIAGFNPEKPTELVCEFLEAATSSVEAAFNPEVGVTMEFEDELAVVAATPCSLIKFSIIFGSFKIFTSRSMSIKPACSLLFKMAATTSEAAAASASKLEDTPAKGIRRASEETVREELRSELMEVVADMC